MFGGTPKHNTDPKGEKGITQFLGYFKIWRHTYKSTADLLRRSTPVEKHCSRAVILNARTTATHQR